MLLHLSVQLLCSLVVKVLDCREERRVERLGAHSFMHFQMRVSREDCEGKIPGDLKTPQFSPTVALQAPRKGAIKLI